MFWFLFLFLCLITILNDTPENKLNCWTFPEKLLGYELGKTGISFRTRVKTFRTRDICFGTRDIYFRILCTGFQLFIRFSTSLYSIPRFIIYIPFQVRSDVSRFRGRLRVGNVFCSVSSERKLELPDVSQRTVCKTGNQRTELGTGYVYWDSRSRNTQK